MLDLDQQDSTITSLLVQLRSYYFENSTVYKIKSHLFGFNWRTIAFILAILIWFYRLNNKIFKHQMRSVIFTQFAEVFRDLVRFIN